MSTRQNYLPITIMIVTLFSTSSINNGKTPLSLAKKNGNNDLVELLKKHGAEE